MSSTATISPAPLTGAARPAAARREASRWAGVAASLAFWSLVAGYVVVFCALSLRRYDAFLMHALDMGNMEQAAWHTLHGQPFQFTNMLDPKIGVEAFGTNTRLSFHV